VLLSHLIALDFYVSYLTEGPVGHTFVSFIFDNAPPLSISIETRPEVGEGFAPVASLFKQFGMGVTERSCLVDDSCISLPSFLHRPLYSRPSVVHASCVCIINKR
jgi:hypothetical protein